MGACVRTCVRACVRALARARTNETKRFPDRHTPPTSALQQICFTYYPRALTLLGNTCKIHYTTNENALQCRPRLKSIHNCSNPTATKGMAATTNGTPTTSTAAQGPQPQAGDKETIATKAVQLRKRACLSPLPKRQSGGACHLETESGVDRQARR